MKISYQYISGGSSYEGHRSSGGVNRSISGSYVPTSGGGSYIVTSGSGRELVGPVETPTYGVSATGEGGLTGEYDGYITTTEENYETTTENLYVRKKY